MTLAISGWTRSKTFPCWVGLPGQPRRRLAQEAEIADDIDPRVFAKPRALTEQRDVPVVHVPAEDDPQPRHPADEVAGAPEDVPEIGFVGDRGRPDLPERRGDLGDFSAPRRQRATHGEEARHPIGRHASVRGHPVAVVRPEPAVDFVEDAQFPAVAPEGDSDDGAEPEDGQRQGRRAADSADLEPTRMTRLWPGGGCPATMDGWGR